MKNDAANHGFYDPVLETEGKRLESEGRDLLKVEGVQKLAGNGIAESDRQDVSLFRETLKDPNSVAVGAILQRLRLFDEIPFLDMAIDASETIGARNSPEKVLVHQMAACYVLSMRLTTKATRWTNSLTTSYSDSSIQAAAKLVNSSARLMDTYQRGLATLAKIRSRGKQKSRSSMFM